MSTANGRKVDVEEESENDITKYSEDGGPDPRLLAREDHTG